VALSADDPLLFSTSTAAEYAAAGAEMGISGESLRKMAQRGWRGAFGLTSAQREAGVRALETWVP
jgi:adenosine deaminase